ncbi:protein CROC-4-like [Sapajus apella]|uniref:Protein CROC-4-like n=1 Tax=Sapajus apella TaxID=9515 RepID=A0A6J3GF02_SAPAP|nr:protein CROC-4-like [Sapajus apella]
MGTLGSIFSPRAGGCSTTLPPSFRCVDDRATSSTTDSSRAPSSRPPGSTSRCGISTEGTQWCLHILPLRTSQVPDMMAPRHRQEPKRKLTSPTWIPSEKPSQLSKS